MTLPEASLIHMCLQNGFECEYHLLLPCHVQHCSGGRGAVHPLACVSDYTNVFKTKACAPSPASFRASLSPAPRICLIPVLLSILKRLDPDSAALPWKQSGLNNGPARHLPRTRAAADSSQVLVTRFGSVGKSLMPLFGNISAIFSNQKTKLITNHPS